MPQDPNRRTGLTAQVHRFRDHVGVHVGTGETAYMSPRQARKLARALYVAAQDVDKRSFQESGLRPTDITIN